MPQNEEEWLNLAKKTNSRWQFPNSFGTGSEFCNYKGFCSLVLMSIVNYDYKFLYVDVGCQGLHRFSKTQWCLGSYVKMFR